MRIIAGSKRGLTLEAPDGQTTRPTADRARQALFDILSAPARIANLRGRPVADFFAGTGALGLEAISRGALSCTFLETDSKALTTLNRNITKAGWQQTCTVLRQDATKPPKAKQACGLLFFDAPYHATVSEAALSAVVDQGWLASDGVAVVQLHPKAPFETPVGLTLTDDRRYGASRFLFLEPA
ncbi:16S rRNA (guanine(966)-N(2))-methyltransferase RsmD [Rhodospirillaceae bacterium KN72]|uniref:16S rRNA (Guanine(966)-N(2))-methyltransferase RsmD n=1 Tax=Pacificispira spongiicola TaxID=2729598 RepID=A0A7Y0HH82_9PROT|nr:16S rRNA (guanine(966)-N(2))-methyltransferase RsmD [Pacificispira spongiicola]NMM46448.1 16S rRNA (guanine(966)-N(2))-methyltransferase RsmD [Pacificispira spongiicola]